ncbi:anti-sigma-I factor RsgI family protein [Acetivibrio cellulolyticus]|uniref:anti-sigma-I factor RsgI family protein n=1 Tax=Acetivibrio cellulolyticus TaxID=35830 RepID=UPI0001E2C1D6|nr:trypsin-like peptidase domain-containing protein [Acetivibrio cellulolyticus]
MLIFGVVYGIQNDKAIVLTDEKKFLAIKKRDGMFIGQTVKFGKEDICKSKSKVYLYSPSSKRIEELSEESRVKNLTRLINIKNFSRINSTKNFNRVSDIKNFTRISNSKDAENVSDIKGFTRVSNSKDRENVPDIVDFTRVSSSKDSSNASEIKGFTRVSGSKDSSKETKVRNFSRITRISGFSRVVGIAAAFVMVFMFSRYALLNKGASNEYACIGIDINPSIEIVIDNEYKVIETVAKNSDAESVLNGLKLEGIPLKSAISEIANKAESCGYFSDSKNVVVVSMALNNKSKEYNTDKSVEEEKLNNLKQELEENSIAIEGTNIIQKTVLLTPEEMEAAKEKDISMGRYSLYMEAKEKGVEISINEAKESSLEELVQNIEVAEESVVQTPTPLITEYPTPTLTPSPVASPTVIPTVISTVEPTKELSAAEIEELGKSIVTVNAYNKNKKAILHGSGFCVAPGLFVTNYHVIENAVCLKITTNDGRTYNVEGIVKMDKKTDLAILKTVKDPGVKALETDTKPVLDKGDRIAAIGSQNGNKYAVSEGSIVGFKKRASIDLIQIEVPLLKGNSGGPLFDMEGNVIGIASYGVSDNSLNLAIPIDYVSGWIKELSKYSFKNTKVIRRTLSFDDNYDLNIVVFNIVNALEKEDMESYFSNMTEELYSEETKNNLEVLFKNYELTYNLESLYVASQNADNAVVKYVYSIYKGNGPDFKNCRITGSCNLKNINGVWKIAKSEEKIEYIN